MTMPHISVPRRGCKIDPQRCSAGFQPVVVAQASLPARRTIGHCRLEACATTTGKDACATSLHRAFGHALAVAITALLLSCAAEASVIYSNLQDIAIPTTFDGVYLDIDTGTTGTAEFTGWDVNPFFGGYGVANSPAFQPVRTGTGASNQILRLNVGDVISSARNFATGYGDSASHLGAGGTQFGSGQEAYLGFKFTTNASAGPYYGWLRVVFTVNTAGAVIKDWAYETAASSITAGRVQQSAAVLSIQTTTLSGGSGENYTLGSALANSGANTTAVAKTGAGQWTVTGTNSYTGATNVSGGTLNVGSAASLSQTASLAVNNGGTLLLSGVGGSNIKLNTAAALTLDGGTLSLNGMTSTLDQQVGALTLTNDSVLDFGTLVAGNTFRFADSSGATWASGKYLSIWNWTAGTDHLFFGANSSGLLDGQLNRIKFYSDSGATPLGFAAAFTGSFGELVPVPEPSSVAVALGMFGLIGARERRIFRAASRLERRKR